MLYAYLNCHVNHPHKIIIKTFFLNSRTMQTEIMSNDEESRTVISTDIVYNLFSFQGQLVKSGLLKEETKRL